MRPVLDACADRGLPVQLIARSRRQGAASVLPRRRPRGAPDRRPRARESGCSAAAERPQPRGWDRAEAASRRRRARVAAARPLACERPHRLSPSGLGADPERWVFGSGFPVQAPEGHGAAARSLRASWTGDAGDRVRQRRRHAHLTPRAHPMRDGQPMGKFWMSVRLSVRGPENRPGASMTRSACAAIRSSCVVRDACRLLHPGHDGRESSGCGRHHHGRPNDGAVGEPSDDQHDRDRGASGEPSQAGPRSLCPIRIVVHEAPAIHCRTHPRLVKCYTLVRRGSTRRDETRRTRGRCPRVRTSPGVNPRQAHVGGRSPVREGEAHREQAAFAAVRRGVSSGSRSASRSIRPFPRAVLERRDSTLYDIRPANVYLCPGFARPKWERLLSPPPANRVEGAMPVRPSLSKTRMSQPDGYFSSRSSCHSTASFGGGRLSIVFRREGRELRRPRHTPRPRVRRPRRRLTRTRSGVPSGPPRRRRCLRVRSPPDVSAPGSVLQNGGRRRTGRRLEVQPHRGAVEGEVVPRNRRS